jgi:hypothetical protein
MLQCACVISFFVIAQYEWESLLVLLCTSELIFLFTCTYIKLKKKLKEKIISLVYVWCFLCTSVQISLVSIYFRNHNSYQGDSCLHFLFAGYFNCQIKVGFGGL